MKVEINPSGLDAEYLRCLNACFGHWGDERLAKWAFHRALAPDPMADRMLLRDDDGALLAGSAVSYRTVILADGKQVRAGIMTGSWTLPAARGRGCFTRIIEESVAMTRERGGALLLAFVTEENPSRRQLMKAGAAAIPTWYLVADGSSEEEKPELSIVENAELADVFSAWKLQRSGRCHFAYAGFEDWKGQFFDRPVKVLAMRDVSGAVALVEKHETTDRIQAYLASSSEITLQLFERLRRNAAIEGRKVFSFTMDEAFANGCERLGFRKIPGYLTVMAVGESQVGEAPLPEEHAALVDAGNPRFLGKWDLQSGDRM